jgi:hypothetical protein
MSVIRLHNVTGFARRSGTDQDGNEWTEFELDPFSGDCECAGPECDPDTCPRFVTQCSICDAAIGSGWMCLDGGEEVCEEHVLIENEQDRDEDREANR